jgi:hypothetical protein
MGNLLPIKSIVNIESKANTPGPLPNAESNVDLSEESLTSVSNNESTLLNEEE